MTKTDLLLQELRKLCMETNSRIWPPEGTCRTTISKHSLTEWCVHCRAAEAIETAQSHIAELREALRKAEDGDAMRVLANYRAIRRVALAKTSEVQG